VVPWADRLWVITYGPHLPFGSSDKLYEITPSLEQIIRPESVGGMRFERLRSSLPLWMQLLAVLLITWILAEPRWIREDSHQMVVMVMDSSASMSTFKDQTQAMLAKTLSQWQGNARKTEWRVLESDPRKPVLYVGESLAQLLGSLDKWKPTMGTHLPKDAFLTARSR